MTANPPRGIIHLIWSSCLLLVVFLAAVFAGISAGSSGGGMLSVLQVILGKSDPDSMLHAIIWQIRLPRVLLAALVGATLSWAAWFFKRCLEIF